jgi:signal transduction histidine kinase
MSARRTTTLATRVTLALALAALLPALLVGGLAIRRAQVNLEREVVSGHLALIRATGESLDRSLQSARRALDLAAETWADDRHSDDVDDPASRASSERLLRRLRREVPMFATLSIVDVHGQVLYGDALAGWEGVGAHTYGGYIGDVVFVDGEPRVRAVSQARSRTGELVGVFVAQLDLGFIGDTLSGARLGAGARLFVVDGRGVPVAHTQALAAPASLRDENPAVARALGQASEGSLEHEGVVAVYRNLSGFRSLRGVSWAIVLEQPSRDAYALARETARDTTVAGAAVLAFALVLGVALARRLTRPLRALAARADAIAASGGPPVDGPPAPTRAPGEIGQLAERLEDMAHRLGEREQLRIALARGERLATVGTIAASVTHEINNPLTTVLGYAKFLAEDKPEDHPDRPALDLIAEEAARMKTIVGDLLDYARSDKTPTLVGSTDVGELMRRTEALLAPTLRRQDVHVAIEVPDELPRAAVDTHGLQQVFVNLVQNAAQAMPGGGTITISGGTVDDMIEIRIADEGPGIPPELRERIFEPFVTTKAAGEGTGLGLAVCRFLVGKMAGRLEVADAPGGRGAELRVRLPVEG